MQHYAQARLSSQQTGAQVGTLKKLFVPGMGLLLLLDCFSVCGNWLDCSWHRLQCGIQFSYWPLPVELVIPITLLGAVPELMAISAGVPYAFEIWLQHGSITEQHVVASIPFDLIFLFC